LTTWTVVYEQTATGWSAYVPALPGVGVAASTREETEQLVAQAITIQLEGLAEDGLPLPNPDSVDIATWSCPARPDSCDLPTYRTIFDDGWKRRGGFGSR
jgi:predicted RNase H-like HicB family nuclease